jgi:hypothetical protein
MTANHLEHEIGTFPGSPERGRLASESWPPFPLGGLFFAQFCSASRFTANAVSAVTPCQGLAGAA